MSILADFRTRLVGNSSVSGLATGGVHIDITPPEEYRPHLLFYITYEDTEDCLTHFMDFQSAAVRVEAIANSRAEAEALMRQCEKALDGWRGRHSGSSVFVNGVKRKTGKTQLVDTPQDGTDQWRFRTLMNFDVNYYFVN